MQDDFFIAVAEVHIVKDNIALQLFVGDCAIRLMGMPPGPQARPPGCFRQGSVRLFLHIDQLHIAVVRLRLLIQQLENALRPGYGHDDAVELLADLGDGLGEVSVQIQIGDQSAEGQAPHAVQGQDRSQHSAQHIADVPQVSVDRHEDIGDFICVFGALPQLLIDFPEGVYILPLMAEYLGNLLPLHHLLDVGVDLA